MDTSATCSTGPSSGPSLGGIEARSAPGTVQPRRPTAHDSQDSGSFRPWTNQLRGSMTYLRTGARALSDHDGYSGKTLSCRDVAAPCLVGCGGSGARDGRDGHDHRYDDPRILRERSLIGSCRLVRELPIAFCCLGARKVPGYNADGLDRVRGRVVLLQLLRPAFDVDDAHARGRGPHLIAGHEHRPVARGRRTERRHHPHHVGAEPRRRRLVP